MLYQDMIWKKYGKGLIESKATGISSPFLRENLFQLLFLLNLLTGFEIFLIKNVNMLVLTD